MLFRNAYFNAKSENSELTRSFDRRQITILRVEKLPVEMPLMAIEVINSIPIKLARLWQVPYLRSKHKNIDPMIRTVITWDTSLVTRYWAERKEMSQFNRLAYVGDQKNKEMHEQEKDTSWMPLSPKIKHYIVSFKKVEDDIIPEDDIPVTDPKIIKEMKIMGVGGGRPAYGYSSRYKDMDEQYNEHETFPYLRWDFYTSILEDGSVKYSFQIQKFYIEFLDTRFDIREAYSTRIPGYKQKMTHYGTLREYAGRGFEDYNEYAEKEYKQAKGITL